MRKLIHLGGAIFPLLYLVFERRTVLAVALVAAILALGIEGGRQRWPALERLFEKLIGSALREGERSRPTAGLGSLLSILISLLAFARALAIPAMFYAQLGDPAAEVVGRRWGQRRPRFWGRRQLPNGKSLEGSLGCFVVSLIAGLLCCQVLPLSPGVAALGALVATLAEAAPLPLGDNLLMAPLSGLAMTLAALAVN